MHDNTTHKPYDCTAHQTMAALPTMHCFIRTNLASNTTHCSVFSTTVYANVIVLRGITKKNSDNRCRVIFKSFFSMIFCSKVVLCLHHCHASVVLITDPSLVMVHFETIFFTLSKSNLPQIKCFISVASVDVKRIL